MVADETSGSVARRSLASVRSQAPAWERENERREDWDRLDRHSPRLLQPFARQLRQVLHRQRAVIQYRLVVAPQRELLSLLALHLLPQVVERHPPDEVRRKLTRTQFGAHHLALSLALRL